MIGEANIDTDAALIEMQADTGGQVAPPIFIPTGLFVGSVNAQTGSVVLAGGTTGYAFSGGAGIVTLVVNNAATIRSSIGLGTIATQNANSVTITGGSITGITDLAVADGGTGSSTASGARSNLSAAVSGANTDITNLTGLTGGLRLIGYTSSAGDPTTTELPTDKDLAIHRNTGSGNIYLAFNNSGTIVKVQLT